MFCPIKCLSDDGQLNPSIEHPIIFNVIGVAALPHVHIRLPEKVIRGFQHAFQLSEMLNGSTPELDLVVGNQKHGVISCCQNGRQNPPTYSLSIFSIFRPSIEKIKFHVVEG